MKQFTYLAILLVCIIAIAALVAIVPLSIYCIWDTGMSTAVKWLLTCCVIFVTGGAIVKIYDQKDDLL